LIKKKRGVKKMFIQLNKRSGQTTAEYAILIGLVVGAAMAMQVYVKRGLNGRIREAVDHTGVGGAVGGEQLVFSGKQYEPYYNNQAGQSGNVSVKEETLANPGNVTRNLKDDEVGRAARVTRTGWGADTSIVAPALDDPDPIK
jgi:hypothetical protein